MRRLAYLILSAAFLLVASSASAQSNDTFLISFGLFPTSFSTSARLSPKDAPGTDIDLEDDLGLDSNAQNLRVEGAWRFKPKHRFAFAYTSWRRTAENDISKQIIWGDKVFDVGATVKAINNAQFIKIAYRYSLVRTERTELDISGGLDTVWNRMSLEGEATLTDDTGSEHTGFYKEQKNFIAPAPVLGIAVSHVVKEDLVLRGSVEYFQATIDDTTGKILDTRASVDWLFSPRYSAGIGYNWVGYEVERKRFDAQYDFSGPIIYFAFRR